MTGEAVRARRTLALLDALHLNRAGRAWGWLADLYAAALALLALTGLFVLKGRNGITRRGAALAAPGLRARDCSCFPRGDACVDKPDIRSLAVVHATRHTAAVPEYSPHHGPHSPLMSQPAAVVRSRRDGKPSPVVRISCS